MIGIKKVHIYPNKKIKKCRDLAHFGGVVSMLPCFFRMCRFKIGTRTMFHLQMSHVMHVKESCHTHE